MANRTCSIPGCSGAHVARGWCTRHYQRWKKHGDPVAADAPTRGERGHCSVEGCERPHSAKGFCPMHYIRWLRHGTPTPVGITERMRGAPLADRFWAKVDRSGGVPAYQPDLGSCWVWLGSTVDGYGRFYVNGRRSPAHRVAWLLSGHSFTAGLELDHLCRNRSCVNPAHLEEVTTAENIRRMMVARKASAA